MKSQAWILTRGASLFCIMSDWWVFYQVKVRPLDFQTDYMLITMYILHILNTWVTRSLVSVCWGPMLLCGRNRKQRLRHLRIPQALESLTSRGQVLIASFEHWWLSVIFYGEKGINLSNWHLMQKLILGLILGILECRWVSIELH